MNLVELITKYQADATPEQMVQVTKIIGKFVAMHAEEDDLLKLYKEIYMGLWVTATSTTSLLRLRSRRWCLRMTRR